MNKRHQCILFSLLLCSTSIFAQSTKVVNDYRTLSSLKIKQKFSDDLSAYTEIKFGLHKNSTKIWKIQGDLGVSYNPIKCLDMEAEYRYSKNRISYSNSYKLTHTFAFSAQYSKRIDLLKYYVRLKLQNTDDELYTFGDKDLKHIVKTRLKLKYDIWGSKFSPYVLSELYLTNQNMHFSIKKLKSCIGIEYDLKNNTELDVFYRNDQELNNYLNYTYHTLGISHTLNI